MAGAGNELLPLLGAEAERGGGGGGGAEGKTCWQCAQGQDGCPGQRFRVEEGSWDPGLIGVGRRDATGGSGASGRATWARGSLLVCLLHPGHRLPAPPLPPILCWLGSYLVPPARRLLRLQGPGAREWSRPAEARFRVTGCFDGGAGPAEEEGCFQRRRLSGPCTVTWTPSGRRSRGRRPGEVPCGSTSPSPSSSCAREIRSLSTGAPASSSDGVLRVDAEEPRLLVRYLQ